MAKVFRVDLSRMLDFSNLSRTLSLFSSHPEVFLMLQASYNHWIKYLSHTFNSSHPCLVSILSHGTVFYEKKKKRILSKESMTANSLVSSISWGNAFSLSSGDSSLVPFTAGGKLAAPALCSWPPSVVKVSPRPYLWCSCLFHPAETFPFCSRERTGKDCSDWSWMWHPAQKTTFYRQETEGGRKQLLKVNII